VLSLTDDSWEMLQDSNNQHLTIGLFQFHNKGVSTYTKADNSCDVLAAVDWMVLLQLEEFLVFGHLTHICNSQMKFLKMSSHDELTNHNSFGPVNKKYARFVIDFISVQSVFNNQQLVPFLNSICSISFCQEYFRRSQASIEEESDDWVAVKIGINGLDPI
jgi:hypothetical protein